MSASRSSSSSTATPDRPALIFGEDVLTYAEFNRLADQLAADLRRRGVGPDHFVGVFAERSFELMIAVYAIIKAGGAYVPLDPDHPADRLRFMADDAGLALILTQAHLADRLPTGAAEAVIVDVANWGWTADPAPQSDEPPADNAGPGNVAYLLYTSGSTGRPKGVMIEHRSIINRLRWMQDAFPLDGTDVVLQKTPYTFDVSVWELFWPLLEGASLVLAAPGDHRDPAALVRTIAANRVTTLHFVPSMLALFVEEPSVPQCETIRRVICSGEALPRALQDRLFAVLDTELHNLYGPTEAAVDVTWWACDPASPLDTVPIGYPIANTEVHVLDRRLRRVPRGTAGELCIGGVQVARGYHGRDELTADRFVPDPYRSTPGARLYRTGDLVRHHPDGAVEFLGRLDHQVKLHGQRIELGEIEAAIAAHDATREVVVTAAGAGTTEAVLVAYVVANGEPATLEAELREHCGRSLAAYMVPSIWMFLDEMPLNANGKADRKALPEPALIRSDRAIVDPASQLERDIVAVWEQVLETSPIGTTDTFFDVGGNSLLLVVLAQRLTERLGREVGVAELLRHTTVAAQAEHLRPSDDAGDDQAGPGSPDADAAVAAGRDRARARRARRRRTGG
ncbi:MAG: amino acid adenylation domain-containing protein [Actinomycetota bacterium]